MIENRLIENIRIEHSEIENAGSDTFKSEKLKSEKAKSDYTRSDSRTQQNPWIAHRKSPVLGRVIHSPLARSSDTHRHERHPIEHRRHAPTLQMQASLTVEENTSAYAPPAPTRSHASRLIKATLPLLGLLLTFACDHGRMNEGPVGPDKISYPSAPQAQPLPTAAKSEPAAVSQGLSAPANISGTISLAAALSTPPLPATVFVIARQEGIDRGPPLATARLEVSAFPAAFSLGQDQVMIQGLRFEGKVNLSARLDSDGNAMTKGSGDISGSLMAPVAVGSQNLVLELNTAL